MTKRPAGKQVRFAENDTERNLNLGMNSYSSAEEYDSDVDDALEADITSSRRRARQVNVDGYGSDASDQDEVGNLSDYSDEEDEKGPEDAADDDEEPSAQNMDEGDMFADGVGRSDLQPEKKRKRFLDLDDIEGQEMSSASRTESANDSIVIARYQKGKQPERNEAESQSGSDDEADGRGRIKIEAFNMKDDLEEGKFDASGNFIWNKKDPQAYQDDWLGGISKGAIERARESKARQDNAQLRVNSEQQWEDASKDEIIVEIINILQPRETVLTALARIGGPKQKSKNKWANKKKEKLKDSTEDNGKETERRLAIERLTVLADQALSRGIADIYDETYEQLVRKMRVAGCVPDDWQVGTRLQLAATDDPGPTGLVGELLGDLDELDS